jgi:hypothetical protein
MGDVFDQITSGNGQPNAAPSSQAHPSGDVFDAVAAQASQPSQSSPQQPTGISRLWTLDNPDPNAPKPDNIQQIKDAAIGAGKTIAKGLGNIGDIATLGITHLSPNSDKASAGIGAQGTALNPANEDQKAGGYIGDAINFELGSRIFDSLAHLPLAERIVQSAKALKTIQDHPVLAHVAGKALTSAGEAGTGTFVDTGSPKKAAEGAAIGAVAGPALEGVSAVAGKAGKVASAISGKASEIASGLRNLATDIPKETESKLVSAIGDAAENSGFERGEASTLKDAVSNLADNFKSRAQGVYQQLDEDAPGFQELKDKIANLKSAYKQQLNFDPTKADEIAGTLKSAEANMADLLDDGQRARWSQADQDWSRYKALQQVQGKANRAASDLTSDELQDVGSLHSGVRSLTNATRKGAPIDVLAKAFGDDAASIRQIVQDASDIKSNTQAAKLFLKWAGYASPVVGGAIYGGSKLAGALSGSH